MELEKEVSDVTDQKPEELRKEKVKESDQNYGSEGAGVKQSLSSQIFSNPVIQDLIFSYLPSDPRAVKAASLVSRTWNSLLDKPKYWTWATAQLRADTFSQIFDSRRFRNIGSVVTSYCLSGYHLRTLVHGLGDCSLKKIRCVLNSFTAVAPEVLAQALVRLEEVDLEECVLSKEVARAIMKAIGETDQLNLKTLKLGSVMNGDFVESELFRYFLRIEDLMVEDMDPKQVTAFYQYIEEIGERDLKLRKLTFGVNSATFSMEEEVLAKTWPRLERIVVRTDADIDTALPSIFSEQVAFVFQRIMKSEGNKLKYIKLPREIRAELPVNLLTEIKTKMKVVFSDNDVKF